MPNPVLHQLNVLGSVVSSTVEAWRGSAVLKGATTPALPLKLYDMEGCPFCRTVREALTALGIDAEIYPCPKGGSRFRQEVQKLGGKQQFPYLVDPNTGVAMYESEDIVAYLFRTYNGGRAAPAAYQSGKLKPWFGVVATGIRGMRGLRKRDSRAPEQLLHLWSFESSPYTRLVRERLTELELPYVLHNIGKEQFADIGPAVMRVKPGPYKPMPGGKREKVLAQLGRVQVPYLEDPNTGVKMFESADIIDYLEKTYAV